MVDNFEESAARFREQSAAITRAFEEFSKEVTQFSSNFQDFAIDRLEDKQQELEAIEAQIRGVQSQIEGLQAQIDKILDEAGITAFNTAVGEAIFPGFAQLVSLAAIIILGLAPAIKEIREAIERKQGEIPPLNRAKAALMSNIVQLEAAQNVLGTITTEDIPILTDALSAFTGVWEQVMDGSGQIRTYLNSSTSAGLQGRAVDTPPVVYAYLQTARSVFGPMGDGLLDYAKGITGVDRFTREDKLKVERNLPKWANVSPAVHKAVCRFVEHRGAYAKF